MHRTTVVKTVLIFFLSLIIQGTSVAQPFDISQTLSDGAQRNTIAFSGVAFLSGDFCSSSFLPPGKVADYCGFQYMRDNEPAGFGHNTDFLTIVAYNVLDLLDTAQIDQFVDMANDQLNTINDFAYARFPLIEAFYRLYEGNVPPNSNGLNQDSVMEYSASLYNIDGQISYQRAKGYGQVIQSFSTQQTTTMDSLVALSAVADWDNTVSNPIAYRQLPHDIDVLVMTYASEMFSWYWGDVVPDVYFAPERQADYFGSFYMKDAPAMGNPGYQIDTSATQVTGQTFLDSILTPSQSLQITSLVDLQRDEMDSIVSKRTQIATLLRGFLSGSSVDSSQVIALSEAYGRLDGLISYYYATAFASVGNDLTQVQMDSVMALRDLDDFPCSGAYLYSDVISVPTIPNTDFLFNILTTALTETSENSKNLLLYPNPVETTLNLTFKDQVPHEATIRIINSLGQTVLHTHL